MIKILTFEQWLKPRITSSATIHGRLAEDGYAWYLEQQLNRTPTIAEVKEYGKITLLTTD